MGNEQLIIRDSTLLENFDNLILETENYIDSSEVYVMYSKHLSPEQEEFMVKELKFKGLWDYFEEDKMGRFVRYIFDEHGQVWGDDNLGFTKRPVIHFNDIFKEGK